jgi:hypothetical protein
VPVCLGIGLRVLPYRLAPEIRRVRLGTLDGDPGKRAIAHVWSDSKSTWFEITDGLERWSEAPPAEYSAALGSSPHFTTPLQLLDLLRVEGIEELGVSADEMDSSLDDRDRALDNGPCCVRSRASSSNY